MNGTMMELKKEKMAKAIEKAKQIRPRVRWVGERTFTVTGSRPENPVYVVTFSHPKPGLFLGQCDCKAGERGYVCYHLAAAAALNIAIQSQRKAEAVQAASVPAELYICNCCGALFGEQFDTCPACGVEGDWAPMGEFYEEVEEKPTTATELAEKIMSENKAQIARDREARIAARENAVMVKRGPNNEYWLDDGDGDMWSV